MTKKDARAFIANLKRAQAAVRRGDTGCQEMPGKCWHCAMRKRADATGDFWRFEGPDSMWSLKRPKSHTLAMFDNSIAAMERVLNGKGTSRD